jgi:hypothetical protein
MYRAFIAAAVAGFALSGCVTKPVAAPAEFAWSYSVNPGEGAKLAYGRPQSDDVLVLMVCAPGGAEVSLSASGLSGARMMLASGQARTSVQGSVSQGFDGEDGLVEASLPARAPALAAFRQSGDLNMTSGGRTVSLSAVDADRSAVKRFFAACAA